MLDNSLNDLLLLLLEHHFQGFFVELSVSLYHKFLKGYEIIHSHNLTNDFFMLWVCLCLVTSLQKLLLGDIQLGH